MKVQSPGVMVSVCIQTYQQVNYIKQCLDSVVDQQTNFPYEIILGEDDSTDGTKDICMLYAEKYPNLIRLFLRSENDKIYINGQKTGRFNFLSNLAAAHGKYIALLDGDDYWIDNKKLQKQVEFMESNPDCSLCFHSIYYKHKRRSSLYTFSHNNWPEKNTIFSIEYLYKGNRIGFSSCMFMQKNIRELPSWLMEVPFIDYPLHMYNAQKGNIGFLAEKMSVYRFHPNGIWAGAGEIKRQTMLWKLYSIMSKNLDGDVGIAMKQNRLSTGRYLVNFYKNHVWKKAEWFKKELELKTYIEDNSLLTEVSSSPTLKNYLLSGWNFLKDTLKVIIGRY